MMAAMTSTLQKLYAAETKHKRPQKIGHYRVISWALGAASVALMFTDLPDILSYALMGLSLGSWLILRAVRQG